MSNNAIPPDQAERDRIVRDLDQSMLVEAAAGTGKTTSIINRMVALLAQGHCRIESIAAVTFTRKAASEIRDRFQLALQKEYLRQSGRRISNSGEEQSEGAASAPSNSNPSKRLPIDEGVRERLAEALAHQQRCFIGTIHSFCARLLRERPVEAELQIDFREIDEAEDAEVRIRAWRQYVDTLLATDDPIVEDLELLGLKIGRASGRAQREIDELEELGLELPQLGAAFMEMADFPDVEHWPTVPRPLPELAPVREALQKYLDHLESLDVRNIPPGTCKLLPKLSRLVLASRHVAWRSQGSDNADGDSLEHDSNGDDRSAAEERRRTAGLMSLLEQFEGSNPKAIHKQWPGKKDQAVAEEGRWQDFRDQWALPLLLAWREHRYEKVIQVLRPAMAVYDRLRTDMNALNFQDLLIKARDLLMLPDVRQYFRRRITHLLVDEFQDTDPLQAELMMLLTANDIHQNDWQQCQPSPGSLFVVGDPKQSIYRFRRADIEVYLAVHKILSQTAAIVHLSANFRSDQSMIDWINETFDPVFPEQMTLHQAPRRSLDYGGAGSKVGGETVERTGVEDGMTENAAARYEAKWIAARAQQLLRDHPDLQPHDLMLLTATRKRLNIYADALRHAGISQDVTGGSELNGSEELRLLRDLLRVAARPDDAVALVSVLRGELFGISDQALYRWRRDEGPIRLRSMVANEAANEEANEEANEAAVGSNKGDAGDEHDEREAMRDALQRLRQYERWLADQPTSVAIERIANDVGLTARAAAFGRSRAGAFGKALELLRAGALNGATSDLLERLDALVSDNERRDGAPAMATTDSPMRVMNLHQAKGLEAAVVFLADPSGHERGSIRLHIDRTGSHPTGYLAIYSGLSKHLQSWEKRTQKLLACPVGWSEFESRENEYLQAERERLLYVAATRAGSKLICCPRESKHNPWSFFNGRFPEKAEAGVAESLEPGIVSDPGPVPDPAPQNLVAQKWSASLAQTYRVSPLKELALHGAAAKPVGDDPDGAAWGSAVHTVLEVMLQQPDADVQTVAEAALREQGVDIARTADLIAMLRNVEKSSIWRRALASPQRYCEVPLTTMLPASINHLAVGSEPTIVRGVIDLVFREGDEWVVVDYKSDAVSLIEIQAAATHYRGQLEAYAAAWQYLSNEPVSEQGILFTHHCRYLVYS